MPHDHIHGPTIDPERLAYYQRMATAVREILIEKGVLPGAQIEATIKKMAARGPALGARMVARAWVDSDYKARLLDDGTAAIGELDLLGNQGEHMVVVENTTEVHNLVVCTLCSCYPWPTLGLPPTWYKSSAYRARAVIEPRAVLLEFGLEVSDETEIRVWDSTAEMRYLVLPRRPEGAEDMNEKELADIVTRDSMIGVAVL